MKSSLSENIVFLIKNGKKPFTVHELSQHLNKSKVSIHKNLKKLVQEKILIKQGTPPRVFYALGENYMSTVFSNVVLPDIDLMIIKRIDENFTFISSDGHEVLGYEGFKKWCVQRNYDIEKKVDEYISTLDAYSKFKKNGIIDATQKIDITFNKEKRFLDHLYFLEPYSLPVFGKTKIATWLFHGKQTQNKILMRRVLDMIIPRLKSFININKYDAIAFVPPSVPREIQFMKQLEQALKISVPIVKIEKIHNPIIIQQKSLKDLNDRIQNATSTMVVMNNGKYNKVLVIDDFTGSGATLNVIAQKIKEQDISNIVEGLTITGSMNGFEVIKEI
jgi:predicted amidophosphoribosyltransferase